MKTLYEMFSPPFSIKSGWMKQTTRFLCSRQHENGGFMGRGDKADIYYTLFGILSLHLLDELEKVTAKTKNFISSTKVNDIVHTYAKVASMSILGMKQGIKERKRMQHNAFHVISDYKKDIYRIFLALYTLNHLDAEINSKMRNILVKYIASCQRQDGGFTSSSRLSNSTTNLTSAAIGALFMLDGLINIDAEKVALFYKSVKSPKGGFCASSMIDIADLLSTHTASIALASLGKAEIISSEKTQKYVLNLIGKNGGFRGNTFDSICDIEYTYYGLGTLSLIREVLVDK